MSLALGDMAGVVCMTDGSLVAVRDIDRYLFRTYVSPARRACTKPTVAACQIKIIIA